jgi:hypothetical protein
LQSLPGHDGGKKIHFLYWDSNPIRLALAQSLFITKEKGGEEENQQRGIHKERTNTVVNKKDIDIRTKLWAVNREQFKAQ